MRLGIIKRVELKNDNNMIDIFKEFNLSVNFDDLIIYGVLKGVKCFAEIIDFLENHLNKLHVEKITVFYDDGESTIEVDYETQKMAVVLINSIVLLYDFSCRLFIDQELTLDDKNSGLKLAKQLTQ